jgi:biopolymer transport protein ExbB/TolQ
MKPRPLLLLLVTILISAFAILNFSAFVQPSLLSVGFMQFEAPLGFLLLAFSAILGAVLLSYADHLRKSALLDAGLQSKELHHQRELANKAEASRFHDLHRFLTEEFKQRSEDESAFRDALNTRLDTLESRLPPPTSQT